jgi:MobA/VirD2-like, nuclease domain
LSLNPPPFKQVPIQNFEAAIEQVEQKLGLGNQPRAIVFHEKEGRRHAHVVWSRIDTDKMIAINLPYFKMKLQDVSRDLYRKHEWQMPDGLLDKRDRNPLNFSREEWQQSRRAGLHPKDVKRIFQESWAASDSKEAFSQALLSKGFVLARGDRRGFVALDHQGEVYAIAKYTGIRTKAVRERLGEPKGLPSVEQAKTQIANDYADKLKQHLTQAVRSKYKRSASFEFQRKQLVENQRAEREALTQSHQARWEAETLDRSRRLSSGLVGIWHRLTGRYSKIQQQNEMETVAALQRDRKEKDDLIYSHIQQRQHLNLRQRSELHCHEMEIELLRQDIKQYRSMGDNKASKLKQNYRKTTEQPKKPRQPKRGHKPTRDHGPEL